MPINLKFLAACLVASGTLAVAGCGGSDSSSSDSSSSDSSSLPTRTVDDATVEAGIKEELSVPGAEVTKVNCPSDVQSEPGASFNCSVTWSNGATGKVKVTQESAGNYTYTPVSGSVQVPGSTVEKQIQTDLATQGAPNAQVNCPDTIIVKVDTTVTCDVSDASGQANGTVTYTFSSPEGTVDESSVETQS